MIIFPDIGMNLESIFISNLRLSTIQILLHGHSVSSFGAQIDYFISGIDSEKMENVEKNYSERLVLIPGIGLHPTYPEYIKEVGEGFRQSTNQQNNYSEKLLISCPWISQKINYEHLLNLKSILEKSVFPYINLSLCK